MKTIVITTIFAPTEAVVAFSKLPDWRLIVVGDSKTPIDWSLDAVDYLSVQKQQSLGFHTTKVLPYNHYCRKMIGYLSAIQTGAQVIVDTDDDNIPYENWDFPAFEGFFDRIEPDKGFVNMYQLYTNQKIWPRGLPLDLINTAFNLQDAIVHKDCVVGVWQGLADEDPDVDAVYRLTDNSPCYFRQAAPCVLSKGTISPFNSQNTMVRKELFPLLYLPTSVTFRFTDILRGLVAQPIMWLYNYSLGFTSASVVQKRNPHNYMKDFISEIPMYEHGVKVVDIVTGAISSSQSIEENMVNAYERLLKHAIVSKSEMITLEAWLNDFVAVKYLMTDEPAKQAYHKRILDNH